MGVNGLWAIVSRSARRVSAETLRGQTLAIDASIWLIQFVKAMRDDDGKMVHNAHLVGVFRRVCRLLFHGVRPVFVFDGGELALFSGAGGIRHALQRDLSYIK